MLIKLGPEQVRIIPQDPRKIIIIILNRFLTIFNILGRPNKQILNFGNFLPLFFPFPFLLTFRNNFLTHTIWEKFEISNHGKYCE